MTIFRFEKIEKNALIFTKNEVLPHYWCRNYTIGNFTYM
jgi:hypothetical protein